MHYSVIFSKFTKLFNHPRNLVLGHFTTQIRLFEHLQSLPLATLDPGPLIYFVSEDLPFLDVSYKWNYTICGPWCLAPST